jgi:elongation factor Ts
MAEITVALIKELRERTGCGMMDAKRALQENAGDIEKAIEELRKKGEVKAAKRAGRETAEGRVSIAYTADGRTAAAVSVHCETDFTGSNEEFKALVEGAANAIAASDGDPLGAPMNGGTVDDAIKAMVAKTGENMQIGATRRLSLGDSGYFGQYIHSDGKLAVVVQFSGSDGGSDLEKTLAKDIAMHVAATNPAGLTDADIPAEIVEKERAIALEQARQSGKPDNIVEKIAEGKLKAFFKEVTLTAQPFVKDTNVTVEQHVAGVAKELGKPIALAAYAYIKVGG